MLGNLGFQNGGHPTWMAHSVGFNGLKYVLAVLYHIPSNFILKNMLDVNNLVILGDLGLKKGLQPPCENQRLRPEPLFGP